MKQNKWGFTLIEVVGVIVLIGIIALVTIPIVQNLKRDSRANAFKDSMNSLIRTANNYYAANQLQLKENVIFDFSNEGLNEHGEKLSFSGIAPTSGTVVITVSGNIHLINVTDGTYYANYEKDADDVLEITKTAK